MTMYTIASTGHQRAAGCERRTQPASASSRPQPQAWADKLGTCEGSWSQGWGGNTRWSWGPAHTPSALWPDFQMPASQLLAFWLSLVAQAFPAHSREVPPLQKEPSTTTNLPKPLGERSLRCIFSTGTPVPQWDWAPVAHHGLCWIKLFLLASFPYLSHFSTPNPGLPAVTPHPQITCIPILVSGSASEETQTKVGRLRKYRSQGMWAESQLHVIH